MESFAPGTMLLDRYRIIDELGKGGMGTVFRAEDLSLGQVVALKFLTASASSDTQQVEGLRREVKLARQVSHPNVVRVHDLGSVDKMHFLSMEYVDGEDLSSLLRRIGRLPDDKAVQISRQLCLGLSAAHDQGVLHRDLKPANVMLDGRGNARITDFGIAVVRDELKSHEGSSGTPAYMAPELFTGGLGTVQSDIFSLGLVLYELFTGKRVFQCSTMTELLAEHRKPVPPPSTAAPQIDAETERAILRCLERDPGRRPRSVMAVLAELPGGDALSMAIASGETPSPQMLAMADGNCILCRLRTGILAALVVIGMIGLFFVPGDVKLIDRTPLPRSSQVLADYARTHTAALGYETEGLSRAFGFGIHEEYLEAIRARDKSPERWDRLATGRPAAIDFWYRQSSPRVGARPLSARHLSGKVSWHDPPFDDAGMIELRLDAFGRLREFYAVPQGSQLSAAAISAEADWTTVFLAAGLDIDRFSPDEDSMAIPPVFAGVRRAWSGSHPDEETLQLRIEAASLDGKVVAFSVYPEEWQEAFRYKAVRTHKSDSALARWIKMIALIAAVFMAWRNIREQRGDRRGAMRLGGFIFLAVLMVTLLTANHSANFAAEARLLLNGLARALLVGFQYWLCYIAIEPHVRRLWPETLISWSRILAWKFSDPLVCLNIIAGQLLGVVSVLLISVLTWTHSWNESASAIPFWVPGRTVEALSGLSSQLGSVLEIVAYNVGFSMSFILVMLLLKAVLRSALAAGVAGVALLTATWSMDLTAVPTIYHYVAFGVIATACMILVFRLGLLALLVAMVTLGVLGSFPLVGDFTDWRSSATILALVLTLGTTALAYRNFWVKSCE